MKFLNSPIFRILMLLALVACILIFLPQKAAAPGSEDIPTVQAPSTQPSTQPSTEETVPLPSTEPPLDTAGLIRDITAQLSAQQAPQSADDLFLSWLLETFGADVLLELHSALDADGYNPELWYTLTGNTYAVLTDLYTGAAESSDNIHLISTGTPGQENETTSMVFGGDICFADNYLVMEYLQSSGSQIEDCIDPDLISQMRDADITFLNNEFTISDGGAPLVGKRYTFRAKPENTALYQTLGVDIVSLANNHAFDYGQSAFLDTLDALDAYGIAQIGGGRDLSEAMKPQYYIVGGRKIAFVAATRAEKNILTPAATETSPGVLRCYDTALFLETIRQADANSDFVVACIHWGTEYSYVLEKAQTQTARDYIDAGADLIIGAHAHQLQGIEFYNGKAIFYNLGNFWFNAYEIDTGLVKAELDHDGNVTYTFLPALQKDCVTTSQIGTAHGARILDTLRQYSANVNIDENGVVTEAQ